HREHAVHERGEHVLAGHHAPIKERQARRHEQDQGSRDENPSCIGGVHAGRTLASLWPASHARPQRRAKFLRARGRRAGGGVGGLLASSGARRSSGQARAPARPYSHFTTTSVKQVMLVSMRKFESSVCRSAWKMSMLYFWPAVSPRVSKLMVP